MNFITSEFCSGIDIVRCYGIAGGVCPKRRTNN